MFSNRLRIFCFVCIQIFFQNSLCLGAIQGYAAKGKLLCGKTPAADIRVQLVDFDTLNFDDVLDEATTGADGRFFVQGKTAEVTPIDPMLKIYHDCDDQYMPCQRRWKLFLPKTFILNSTDEAATRSSESEKIFDVGEMNLESNWHKECRTCWH